MLSNTDQKYSPEEAFNQDKREDIGNNVMAKNETDEHNINKVNNEVNSFNKEEIRNNSAKFMQIGEKEKFSDDTHETLANDDDRDSKVSAKDDGFKEIELVKAEQADFVGKAGNGYGWNDRIKDFKSQMSVRKNDRKYKYQAKPETFYGHTARFWCSLSMILIIIIVLLLIIFTAGNYHRPPPDHLYSRYLSSSSSS